MAPATSRVRSRFGQEVDPSGLDQIDDLELRSNVFAIHNEDD